MVFAVRTVPMNKFSSMVHYIRFLKAPQLYPVSSTRQVVKALISITTDLGDDFLPNDVLLSANLIHCNGDADTINECQPALWKAGMRVLRIEVEVDATRSKDMRPLSLLVETANRGPATLFEGLPLVVLCETVSCRSDVGGSTIRKEISTRIERRFMLQPSNMLSIFEDIGESIARHIW